MKSKQRLAKVVALALVLGFNGIYGAMADDIRLGEKWGTKSETIEGKIVHGAWLDDKSMLTASNVTFVDDTTNYDEKGFVGKGEVAVDGGSTLNMTGGAINVEKDYFTATGGSVVNIKDAEVTSGAYANNANITMENSQISGRALYAGNDWEKDAPLPSEKADGQPGKLQVNGGTVNVALIWGQASWKDGASNEGGVYFGKDAEVTVQGTEGLKLPDGKVPDGKVLTGIYSTEHGKVYFEGIKKADISEIHADGHGTVNFTNAADVKTGDVYLSNDSGLEIWDTPKVSIGNVYISSNSYADIANISEINVGNVKVVGEEKASGASAQVPINEDGGSEFSIYEKTKANIKSIDLSNGADAAIGDGASVKVDKLTSDYSYLYMSNEKTNLTVNDLSLNNGSDIVHEVQDSDNYKVEREAAGEFTLGRLNVNNSKINFGQEASVKFDNKLAKDSGLYVSNGGAVNFNGTDVAADTVDTVKADAGTVSLKDSKGTFKNAELTQGASLTADSGAVVTADTLNVQGGARAIAENDGILNIKDAMNITNGGSASVADGGTLKAKSVQVSGNKSTFVQQGKSKAKVSSLAINQGGTASITGGAEAEVANLTIQNASLDLGNGRNKLKVAKSLVSNKGFVRIANDDNKVVLAADTVKADAGTISLKDSKGNFKNVELTQGASLTADSEAVVTADTLNVQGGARAIAENDGILNIKDAMNITNGGSASVADGGTLKAKSVQVSGNKSTFVQQGKSKAKVSSLAINQGGTASITGGAEAEVDNLTIQNASLDLGNGTNTLTVAKSLVSNKGLVRTANGDNKVVLAADAKKTGDVTVQGEGKDYNSDALAGDSNKVKTLAKVVVVSTADGKTAASTVSGSEGVINGASVYKVENTADGDIKVTESYIPENETNRAITDLAALSLITWRQENNDLNKRLGEIRDSKGDDGVWARMARGEATFKGVKNQYNYYQMGYDKKLNDNWILGGAFSYTDGDNTFHSGTGQTKNSSFAVYGSNLRDDGSFIDLIAKYAHLKNEYDTPLGIGSGDYSTNGFSFSGEYGKRFHMDKFWLEPQVELTWGHVDSVNYSTENGARVHQNGMDSFVGRLGFSLGKDFSHGNVYARASYLYDFDGDVKASMTNGTVSREYREDIGGGWFEFGIGTNLNLGSDTHFYFDLERAEGGSGNVKTPWQWNVGVRYSF